MQNQQEDPLKRFKAPAETPERARELLHAFDRKFGNINGQGYFCAETAVDRSPGNGFEARLAFIPWPYPIPDHDKVDFDCLIAKSGATSC